jgi:hypothetical protein
MTEPKGSTHKRKISGLKYLWLDLKRQDAASTVGSCQTIGLLREAVECLLRGFEAIARSHLHF